MNEPEIDIEALLIAGNKIANVTGALDTLKICERSEDDDLPEDLSMLQHSVALATGQHGGIGKESSLIFEDLVTLGDGDAEDTAHEEDMEDIKDKSKRQARLSRHDWETIQQIPDIKFKRLLQFMVDHTKLEGLTVDQCHVISRFDGGFNHIVLMAAIKGAYAEQYVVRVSAIGTSTRWKKGDAHNMRCEVALMKYLRQETEILVPEVVAFENELDSWVGAPYILMKKLPGKPAHVRWFEDSGRRNHITANRVSLRTEYVRRNILCSLATTMVKLQHIDFDKVGMPDFSNTLLSREPPTITHTYHWCHSNELSTEYPKTQDQVYEYGPFDSSRGYMTGKLEENWSSIPNHEDDETVQNILLGIRKILDITYNTVTMTSSKYNVNDNSEQESFVLRHPDLDLQNILTDDDGNITGILDWEGCLAVPRCVGYTSFPEFLRRDWTSTFSLKDPPHMNFQLEHYWKIDTDAMLATGCADAKYTGKSHIYRAIADAVNGNDNYTCSAPDLITKLFNLIPGLQPSDIDEFEMLIGRDWEEADHFLTKTIANLLDLNVSS